MLQYLLTALAGIALGIVGMRIWQSREQDGQDDAPMGQAAAAVAPPAPAAAPGAPRITSRHLLLGAGGLAVVAVAIMALRGPDEAQSAASVAALPGAGADKQLDDVDTMIGKLAARLEKDPTDGEGFRMLGWSYLMTGRPEKAIDPFKRALTLLPNSALVHSGYGEALAALAKGSVTPEARAEFEKAVALDPKEPRSLYFLALYQAQNGQQKEALEKWIALANSGPADAPWQVDLRRQITEVSGKLGVNVSSRLKNPPPPAGAATMTAGTAAISPPPLDAQTVQAANAMPAGDRQAMVDQMVSGLADKLRANPKDVDRWILLLRSRLVLEQGSQARSDLASARQALAGDAAALGKLNAAARELGVPGA